MEVKDEAQHASTVIETLIPVLPYWVLTGPVLGKKWKLVPFRNYLRLPEFHLTRNSLWDQMWLKKKWLECSHEVFSFKKIKLRGKRLPQFLGSLATFTNSGVMRNTWQSCVQWTVMGVLLPPREPEGQAPLLQGPSAASHLGLAAPISGQPARAGQQVSLCGAEALAWGHLLIGNCSICPRMTHPKASKAHSGGSWMVASLFSRASISMALSRHAFNGFEVLLLGCGGLLHHWHIRNALRKTSHIQMQSRKRHEPEEAELRTGNVHGQGREEGVSMSNTGWIMANFWNLVKWWWTWWWSSSGRMYTCTGGMKLQGSHEPPWPHCGYRTGEPWVRESVQEKHSQLGWWEPG